MGEKRNSDTTRAVNVTCNWSSERNSSHCQDNSIHHTHTDACVNEIHHTAGRPKPSHDRGKKGWVGRLRNSSHVNDNGIHHTKPFARTEFITFNRSQEQNLSPARRMPSHGQDSARRGSLLLVQTGELPPPSSKALRT